MVASDAELLPPAVLRAIGDKLYDKVRARGESPRFNAPPRMPSTPPPTRPHPPPQRKVAALEVEQAVKRLAAAGEAARVRAIIDKLIAEYAFSPQANYRKVCVCV